jgi:signal transduction histidine kinase
LGAISSSASSIQATLTDALPGAVAFLLSLGDEDRRTFWDVVLWCASRAEPLAAGSAWERRRSLQARLEAGGVASARRLATLLSDLGAEALLEAMPDLVTHPLCLDLLEAASPVVSSFTLAQIIEVAAQKGAGVVSALRQYLKNEPAGTQALVDVEHDLEVVLTLLQNKVKNHVRVERRFSGVRVWGSSAELSQVWMNLINNAVQAMDYHGTLVLTTESGEGLVRVSVTDSGPGIPPEVRDRIFEPFFTTKAQGEGMGLGLDISRKIVEDHRGRIVVDSRPGRTVFTVELPADPPREDP